MCLSIRYVDSLHLCMCHSISFLSLFLSLKSKFIGLVNLTPNEGGFVVCRFAIGCGLKWRGLPSVDNVLTVSKHLHPERRVFTRDVLLQKFDVTVLN